MRLNEETLFIDVFESFCVLVSIRGTIFEVVFLKRPEGQILDRV